MKLPKLASGRMTQGEYRANIQGLNIFYGAVLGFVMAGTENYTTWQFGWVLLMVGGLVVSILYITSSPHRIFYAIFTLVMIAGLPLVAGEILPGTNLPDKLIPTLIAWTAMTILVEFMPRDRSTDAGPAPAPAIEEGRG